MTFIFISLFLFFSFLLSLSLSLIDILVGMYVDVSGTDDLHGSLH